MRDNRGMTLIEVLVALAVFAVASLSVMQTISQSVNTISRFEERAFASMVVDNQMAMVMLSPAPSSTIKGKSELADQLWYWTIQPIKTSDNLLKAFDISVAKEEAQLYPIVTVRSYVQP
jgi:general secretion pathway protein I